MLSLSPRHRRQKRSRPPIFLRARSSIYYIAMVAGMGLLTDVCLFPLFTPAIPFRLEQLGYTSISSLTGWLTAAYAGGLIVATFPFTWLGSRYKAKRNILLAALALMAVGVLLFLLVPNYAAMVAARFLQGTSGAGIWTLGLALVADNSDPAVLGKMMGLAMVGYSIGTSIGQPIGGVLYGQLGWKAPSIFALALIAFDFVLRILVLEKHEVQRYKRPPKLDTRRETVVSLNVVSPTKEALLSDRSHSLISPISPSFPKEDAHERAAGEISVDMNTDVMPDPTERAMAAAAESIKEESEERVSYNHWLAIAYLLFNMKALTPLLISFVNGFLFSGIYNTALVLRLNQRYGLDSTKAGLVFLAVAGPSAIVSPLSGRLTDRYGPRPLSMLCCGGFVPVLCLLMIDQLPLAAFIVLLVFTGICSGLINSPVMVFLAFVANESHGRVGTSHVYGGFNCTFSVACFLGPIVAGQVLEKLGIPTGFKVQLGVSAALALACVPLAWYYMRLDAHKKPRLRKRSDPTPLPSPTVAQAPS